MIYVRIELWPGGNKNRAQVIGEARIANIAMNEAKTKGWYAYRLYGKSGTQIKTATTTAPFARKRKLAWDLLRLILNEARPTEV